MFERDYVYVSLYTVFKENVVHYIFLLLRTEETRNLCHSLVSGESSQFCDSVCCDHILMMSNCPVFLICTKTKYWTLKFGICFNINAAHHRSRQTDIRIFNTSLQQNSDNEGKFETLCLRAAQQPTARHTIQLDSTEGKMGDKDSNCPNSREASDLTLY